MNPSGLTEDELVEQPALELLAQLGWQVVSGFDEVLGGDGTLGRDSQSESVLVHRLRDAIRELNPGLDETSIGQAIEALVADRSTMGSVHANRDVYGLIRDGVKVDVVRSDGQPEPTTVRLVDWNRTDSNDWLAVSQFWVSGDMHKRRADVVLFVNGIPLVFIELKVSHKNVQNAYQENLRDYRDTIPGFFDFNAFVILSNGADTLMGSTYARLGHFAEWKKINSEGEQGIVSLETALRGTCEPQRLLDLVENFVVYTQLPGGLVKAVAKNHQYLGVNNVIEALHEVEEREGRLGVFWHTQGSGKSLSMLWFTQKVLRRRPGNWTFVMVTDRKELDDQLYETFADSDVITPGTEVHAESSAQLRELLTQDHRYVFTLIHKFIPAEKGAEMPVLSDRDDIVVITDEAHRSQYDTLAGNMRKALPNASFLGFTGTPLIAGQEEETRRVFGDYVSTYNFADSIADGATVPLYYENRVPELQLENRHFDEELEDLLDEAELDEGQEKAISRRFSQQYELITRPKRLQEIASDLVRHFANRGFLGKGMYVAIDKATAIRMYDLVKAEWSKYLAELEKRLERTPELERPALQSQIDWMRETDMAVVVSQAQNEIADMKKLGLDIKPHRSRIVNEDLDSRFKDPADPFRLVFVCAMWLTGFDSPSTSTIYLDKPIRNHTLMQTIARANRVFPEKDNGLIADYIGVFRNLEKALAIYAVDRSGEVGTPIQPKEDLIADLLEAISDADQILDDNDVELADLERAKGFEFVALQKSAVESLLIDEATRRSYVSSANRCRKAYKALMPDPEALKATRRVSVIRSIASKIASESEGADISRVMDGVGELLDRSVGAKEYIIRTVGGSEALVDLNQLDFEQLSMRFPNQKRTATRMMQKDIEKRIGKALRKNASRLDLATRFRKLIDEYNAGTHNLEELFRRLKSLNGELSEEEARSVREGLAEAELAIYDLLTKPEPELSDAEIKLVKGTARKLLGDLEDKLVLDWKKDQTTRSTVRLTVKDVLDDGLPDVYSPSLFDQKVDAIFDHVYSSYFNDGGSVYDSTEVVTSPSAVATLPDTADQISEELLAQIESDPELRARLTEMIFGLHETWTTRTEQLLTGETKHVEFKQSARWSLSEGENKQLSEQIIAKTVAGFLNAEGGTLLVGVTDDGVPVGLSNDFATVKPKNGDGFVNWLDTMLQNALGHAGARRLQIRIDLIDGEEVCRIDVPASSRPIWAKFKKKDEVLFERRNNSTRQVPVDEVEFFLVERFGIVRE